MSGEDECAESSNFGHSSLVLDLETKRTREVGIESDNSVI